MLRVFELIWRRRSYFVGAFVMVALVAAMIAYHQTTEGAAKAPPGVASPAP
jgi:hypothetical protein